MKRQVRISHQGPNQATVEVDGRDLAHHIQGYSISADYESGPRLWISFSPSILPEFDGPAEVEISEDLRDALVFLGWRPPTEGDVAEREISTLGGPERVFLRSDGTYRTEPWHTPVPPQETLNYEGSERWTGGDRKDAP
jgi:hypothetical protein